MIRFERKKTKYKLRRHLLNLHHSPKDQEHSTLWTRWTHPVSSRGFLTLSIYWWRKTSLSLVQISRFLSPLILLLILVAICSLLPAQDVRMSLHMACLLLVTHTQSVLNQTSEYKIWDLTRSTHDTNQLGSIFSLLAQTRK